MKHKIKLKEGTQLFKVRYYCIPPGLYDEVHQPIKELLEIGAIRPSSSTWASAVVLVRKKNGKLRFCIDLCKLNNLTVKDAYSILGIQDTLNCWEGSEWLTLLALKGGYWQVELIEASTALTVFMVGLANAPAIFQHLMETCLGSFQLQWCITYLDDIAIFAPTPKGHIKRLRVCPWKSQNSLFEVISY